MLNGVPSPERHPLTAQNGSHLPPESLPPIDLQFEQLSAYLDGELPASEVKAVEEWLAADPQARRQYSHLRSLQASIDQIAPAGSSLDIDRLAIQVFAQVDQPQVIPLFPRQMAEKVAAAAVLLLGSSLSVWHAQPPQPLISLEDPPVTISSLPASARIAEQYLLTPPASQDPYAILFVEAEL